MTMVMTIVLIFGSDTNLFFGVSYPSPSIWEIKVTLENKRPLENKIAIVVGGGQTVGETIGNGRATAILFARLHAKYAEENAAMSLQTFSNAYKEVEGVEGVVVSRCFRERGNQNCEFVSRTTTRSETSSSTSSSRSI